MAILDFIFPKRCLGCGQIGKYFCDNCRKEIRLIETQKLEIGVLDGLTSFFHYDGVIREAIKSLKYRFTSDLAKEFVSLIPTSFFNNVTIQQFNNSVFVPIPLHPSRFRYRGFNQAELLGKLIAEKFAIPMRTDILIRTKKTIPQVEMKDRKKRLKNMRGVFSFNNNLTTSLPARQGQRYSNVILFDDVFTTGATMRSAASVLKQAGVKRVLGITMAR